MAAHAVTTARAAQQESAGALLRPTFSAVAAILLRRTQSSHPGAQLDWVSKRMHGAGLDGKDSRQDICALVWIAESASKSSFRRNS